MISRTLQPRIEAALGNFPIVAIVGARQTGKTTLARAISERRESFLHLDLERPADLARLAEPELFLRQHRSRLVVLDEVQRRPDIFPVLRVLVDEGRENGRFLVLGSASPDLLRQSSESLAGRIVYFELPPCSVAELVPHGIDARTLWLRGGFPRAILAADNRISLQWREAFLSSYLERDLPQFGARMPAAELRRFWQMLAHLHGQILNASDMARNLGISSPTVGHYLGVFEDTFLLRRLQPYHANLGKRLVKRPRVYVRDSGLLHALFGIGELGELLGHPMLGASWEGFVIEQILGALPVGWQPFFYRTATGVEVDLVLIRPGAAPVAIEIKASLAPQLGSGFRTAFVDLGCERGYCVYPGSEEFPLAPQVAALPVGAVGTVFAL